MIICMPCYIHTCGLHGSLLAQDKLTAKIARTQAFIVGELENITAAEKTTSAEIIMKFESQYVQH